MTISSTTVKVSYSGNGSTTVFAYTFKILDDDEIQVIIRSSTGTETVKTKTTDYTVSGVGSSGGGNITFLTAPTATQTVVLRRLTTQTQETDYIANDPFPADSHEDALDRITMVAQEIQEELGRAIKLSKTNTITSTEFTVAAADRANKILAFDANGEIAVTQELGTYRGNWATATSYNGRDLVKDTSNNNIYIINTAHTSSGAQPLSSNANTAYYTLIVDAASASASATAAAASASAASTSASNASTSASAASSSASTATTQATNASTSASTASTQASLATTAATNAATSETNAGTSASAASTSASNASSSASSASSSASTATTQATNASNSATTATTQASAAAASASTATTQATNASNSAATATTQASNASTSATAAAASAASAATLLDNFDDVYLGSKTSDPTLDNDGDALTAGDLYYNSVGTVLKYYTGSAWVSITSGGITDLVQDTTPQLGGALDVNTFSITSTSNGNITLQPNGTGDVVLSADTVKIGDANTDAILTTDGTGDITISTNSGTNSGTVKIFDGVNGNIEITPNGTGVVKIDGLSYPTADGTASQVLQTNGSGIISFATASSGTPTVETYDSGTAATFTKPSGKNFILVELWGGGGSGGKGIAATAGGGGGGGGYNSFTTPFSNLVGAVTYTVGAGGASQTTGQSVGNVGGNSTVTFASFGGGSSLTITAFGGGGGGTDPGGAGGGGGGGGGRFAAGGTAASSGGGTGSAGDNTATGGGAGDPAGGNPGTDGGNTSLGGGAGGGGASSQATAANGKGGNSYYAGGGGGAGAEDASPGPGAGGTTFFGGAGGAGAFDANNATAGTLPSGGGGGSETGNSGAGGGGRIRFTYW